MESLESRLEQLTPEQRKEVEDFVDFLHLKNTIQQAPATAPPPPIMLNTPPVFTAEPAPSPQAIPVRMQDLMIREEPYSPASSLDPASSPVHEIIAGSDDALTHDYMDYGRFDPQQPSPATEAVKKVKKKLIARDAEEKSRHILDWVD
jgi:hypothetical protein